MIHTLVERPEFHVRNVPERCIWGIGLKEIEGRKRRRKRQKERKEWNEQRCKNR